MIPHDRLLAFATEAYVRCGMPQDDAHLAAERWCRPICGVTSRMA